MTAQRIGLFGATAMPPRPRARDRGRAWRGGSRFPSAGDFRRLDRNDRVRVWVAAQALDRRTHTPGKHGGALGHSGLAVLRCLLFDFLNLASGRLDPSYEALARAANMARSAVIEAVKRLEAAGLLEVTRRLLRERVRVWLERAGRYVVVDRTRQTSNAYRVNFAFIDRPAQGDLGAPLLAPAGPIHKAESGNRTETHLPSSCEGPKTRVEDIADPTLRRALEKLGRALGAL